MTNIRMSRYDVPSALSLPQESGIISTTSAPQDEYVVVTRGSTFQNWSYKDMSGWSRGVYNAAIATLYVNPVTAIPIMMSACVAEHESDVHKTMPNPAPSKPSNTSNKSNTCSDVAEVCNMEDDNCNGQTDEGFSKVEYYIDYDGDGYGGETLKEFNPSIKVPNCLVDIQNLPDLQHKIVTQGGDCNDYNPSVHPGAKDIPANGVDEDCKGGDAPLKCPVDDDKDGQMPKVCGGDDCDDTNPKIYLNAYDYPGNGIDEDCKDGDAKCPIDNDKDGQMPKVCGGDDCDDADKSKYKGHGCEPPCKDETYYKDNDGDGYGVEPYTTCLKPPGYAYNGGDCNDSNPKVYPGAFSSGPYCKGTSLFAVDACSKKEFFVKSCASKEVCTDEYQSNIKSFSPTYISACCSLLDKPFSDCISIDNKQVLLNFHSCTGFKLTICSAQEYCVEQTSSYAYCKKK